MYAVEGIEKSENRKMSEVVLVTTKITKLQQPRSVNIIIFRNLLYSGHKTENLVAICELRTIHSNTLLSKYFSTQYGKTVNIKMTAAVCDYKKILKDIHTGNIEVLKRFHENYPDNHWTCLRYDKTGDTILHVASRFGYLNLIDYILNNYLPKAVDCRNNDNKTALHEAAQFGQSEAVELLLKNGAEVDALKKADWTPLMLACTKVNQSEFKDDHYRTVEVLLKGHAEVNYRNKDGWTPLHLIAREGEVRILELLLDYGLHAELVTKNGRSALHIAALHGNFDMTKKLVRLGLDVNKQDGCGNTPLHESILGSNLAISNLLLDNNADLYCRNKSDFTILHLAAAQGNIDVIDYVISTLNIEVNIKTVSGLTPLHCAARNNKQKDAYDFLLLKGADVNIKDNFGRTSSDYL